MNSTYYDVLSESERSFLAHISRWGSDGYPVSKVGRGWIWHPAFGVNGAPVVYKTKREAFAAVGRFLDSLRERIAVRSRELDS